MESDTAAMCLCAPPAAEANTTSQCCCAHDTCPRFATDDQRDVVGDGRKRQVGQHIQILSLLLPSCMCRAADQIDIFDFDVRPLSSSILGQRRTMIMGDIDANLSLHLCAAPRVCGTALDFVLQFPAGWREVCV